MSTHWTPTMQPTHADRRVSIGQEIYLFLHRAGAYAPKLIISAHGGIRRQNSPQFVVPAGVKLYFYSQHGDTAKASSLSSAMLNGQHTDTVAAPQRCFNYNLTKFQGEHQEANATATRGETYASIQQLQDGKDDRQKMVADLLSAGLPVPMADAYAGGLKDFDILTIRNRFWTSTGVTLENAISAVRKLHAYRDIHCSFCRSYV
jgi:hypothetical protein